MADPFLTSLGDVSAEAALDILQEAQGIRPGRLRQGKPLAPIAGNGMARAWLNHLRASNRSGTYRDVDLYVPASDKAHGAMVSIKCGREGLYDGDWLDELQEYRALAKSGVRVLQYRVLEPETPATSLVRVYQYGG